MEGLTVVSTDSNTISDADIVAYPFGHPQAGMPVYDWGQLPQPINKVDISFDFNIPDVRPGDFGRRQVYAAGSSVQTYGTQRALQIQLRGVREANSGITLMDSLALRLMQRFGQPAWILRLALTYRIGHFIEPSDHLTVTSR